MNHSSAFSDLVDATEKLSLEEKETLLEDLHSRTVEERRERLRREVGRARQEHRAGKARPATVKQLMRELGQ